MNERLCRVAQVGGGWWVVRLWAVGQAAAVSCLSVIVWLVAFRPDIKIHTSGCKKLVKKYKSAKEINGVRDKKNAYNSDTKKSHSTGCGKSFAF